MASKKISQLTAATTPLTGTEELAIVQGSQTLKATAQDIADLAGAPSFNLQSFYESGALFSISTNSGSDLLSYASGTNVVVNIAELGDPSKFRSVILGNRAIAQIKNANLLTNLENIGTGAAVSLFNNSLSAVELNSFFTQLPSTTKTVTINAGSNPGSATCNPAIATAKGYTVTV